MSTDDRYNGWANRETWAVALHINNDQGWQESVLEALTNARESERMDHHRDLPAWKAGDVIRENVEEVLDVLTTVADLRAWSAPGIAAIGLASRDIGSMWRVDWTELGGAFLEDLTD